MVAHSSSSSANYPDLFRHYIGQIVRECLVGLSEHEDEVGDVLLTQALHVLDFALELDELWCKLKKLLSLLAARYERLGPHASWCIMLERAIQRALQINDPLSAELSWRLGIQQSKAGELTLAKQWLDHALQGAIAEQNTILQVQVLNELGHIAQLQRQFEQAKQLVQQALRLLPSEHMELAATHSVLGDIYFEEQNWSLAATELQKAITIWEQHNQPASAAAGWRGLARVRQRQNDFNSAIACYERALTLYDAQIDSAQYAITCMGYGGLCANIGQPHKGLELLAQAEPVLQQMQNRTYLAMLYYNSGLARQALHEWPRAIHAFRASLEQLDLYATNFPDDRVRRVRVLTRLGESHKNLNQKGQAQEMFLNAQMLLSQINNWSDAPRYQSHIEEELDCLTS